MQQSFFISSAPAGRPLSGYVRSREICAANAWALISKAPDQIRGF